MKTILVMRHAAAGWENPGLSDFERPLNQQGLQDAPLAGNLLYKAGVKPDLIVASPAKRALHTAILVRSTADVEASVRFVSTLYEASPLTLIDVISQFENKLSTVVIVGHNPGIESLIRILTGEIQSMETAAIAKIDLDIERWTDLAVGAGTLDSVIRPSDHREVKTEQESIYV